MGSDVAYKVLPPSLPPQSLTHLTYKLSTSWEERYTSLRRVRAEDFEAQDSSIPGVPDLFPLGKFTYITHSLTHPRTHSRTHSLINDYLQLNMMHTSAIYT